MAVLDVIIVPDLAFALAPNALVGLQSHLLDAVVTRQTPPVALIYSSAGQAVSIGRYHLYAGSAERDGIGAYRRLTGGRVVGAGEGWLGLALILPSRTALLKEDASRLKPDQIMNRYARGLLAGLRALGLDCFYPGRDAITFERRELAMCSFETDPSGAMLFEAMLAVNRGMENLVHDLELIDPDGALPCAMYTSDSATTLARELKREVRFDELADAIAAGYEGLLGETRRRELTAFETADASRRALVTSGWLNDRVRIAAQAGTIKKNRIAAQLGAIEAAVAVESDDTIAAITLSGDFIANSSAIAELEKELIGKRLDLGSVSHAVTKIFAHGKNFFLGAGELSNLVRLIAGVN
jgi:lipoate-protein ligase A